MLLGQIPDPIAQGLGLKVRELSGPAGTTDQHRKGMAAGIPGQAPSLSFSLNHS